MNFDEVCLPLKNWWIFLTYFILKCVYSDLKKIKKDK